MRVTPKDIILFPGWKILNPERPKNLDYLANQKPDEIIWNSLGGLIHLVGVVSTVASEKTLNSDDVIDGADGIDTLNLELKSSLAAMSGGISNVENINPWIIQELLLEDLMLQILVV